MAVLRTMVMTFFDFICLGLVVVMKVKFAPVPAGEAALGDLDCEVLRGFPPLSTGASAVKRGSVSQEFAIVMCLSAHSKVVPEAQVATGRTQLAPRGRHRQLPHPLQPRACAYDVIHTFQKEMARLPLKSD